MVTPAFSKAANLPAAVPCPPEAMAPAWPMRLPSGALAPAMKPTTGLVTCCGNELGRFFLGASADFTDHDDAQGLRIVLEQLQAIDEVHALHGIAADADTGRLTRVRHRWFA